jgi:hypothetical protein
LEQLEGRIVPSTLGAPWPDPGHLTLSFVPDGTAAAAGPSDLFAALDAQAPEGVWKETILRAFQTWASAANINVSVVADGGEPLGAPGAVEGDARFGDIRIAARPLPLNSLATATPFQPDGTTWSGDVLLNSSYPFALGGPGGYDLFTVMLHESGHVFGLPDSTDPTSAMDGGYLGPRPGPSAADVRLLQSLYGARPPDRFEGPRGDDTPATAAALRPPAGDPGAPLTADADITTHRDVDYYRFTVDQGRHDSGATVRLQTSHLSLLTARVTVYDPSGGVAATAASTDPLNGDLLIHLVQVRAGATYRVRVEGARTDVFGIGSYRLTVDLHPGADAAAGPHPFRHAVDLRPPDRADASGPLAVRGTIRPGSDTAVYRFQTPGDDTSGAFTVSLQSWGVGIAPPSLTVYDASGGVLAGGDATDPSGSLSLHLEGVRPGAACYVKVRAGVYDAFGIGAYDLAVDFHPAPAGSRPAPALALVPEASNDTFHAAQRLRSLPGYPAHPRYEAIGSLADPGDVDFYRVRSAPAAGHQAEVMTVTVLAQDPAGFSPRVVVYDSHRKPVPATVLANADGTFVVQVAGVQPSRDYYVEVQASGPPSQGGPYFLGVDFGTQAAVPPTFVGSVLGSGAAQEFRTLTVARNELFRFVLSADAGTAPQPAGVLMTVFDPTGRAVYNQIAHAGQQPTTGQVYLGAGTYTVRFVAVAPNNVRVPPLSGTLGCGVLSDPIGPVPIDPTGDPGGSSSGATPSAPPDVAVPDGQAQGLAPLSGRGPVAAGGPPAGGGRGAPRGGGRPRAGRAGLAAGR